MDNAFVFSFWREEKNTNLGENEPRVDHLFFHFCQRHQAKSHPPVSRGVEPLFGS